MKERNENRMLLDVGQAKFEVFWSVDNLGNFLGNSEIYVSIQFKIYARLLRNSRSIGKRSLRGLHEAKHGKIVGEKISAEFIT